MQYTYMHTGLGPNAAFIKRKLPGWIKHSHIADIMRLKHGLWPAHASQHEPPVWFSRAPMWLRQALINSQARSRQANQALAVTLKDLQGITAFAEPRLKEALHSHSTLGQGMDVNTNELFYLRRNQPVQHQSLLQAALMNFEGNEEFTLLVKGQVSALAPRGALPLTLGAEPKSVDFYAAAADVLLHGAGPAVSEFEEVLDNLQPVPGFSYREKLAMSPQVFSQICRALDLGQQYQEHLSAVFDAPDKAPIVRRQMIGAQKELLAVHAHTALMQGHISEPAWHMLRAVLEGSPQPSLLGKPVVFSQLQLYGLTLADVLLIGPYRSTLPVTEWEDTGLGFKLPVMKKPDMEPLVVYIPGDPQAPLKQYPSLEAFQYALGLKLRSAGYQQLLASLMPQGAAATFISRLNHQLYQKKPDPKGHEAPVYVDEVDLKLSQVYLDMPPRALFQELYRLHLDRLKGNARKLAVPTADADSKLLQERLDYWLGLGLDAVNVAAFFVPGLGEVMMAVMALQMTAQIYHGIEAWSVGDVEGAWANLQSVAINVALAGAMGGAGYALGKLPEGSLSRWVDQLKQIVLPNGETRLWNPDLGPYQCDAPFAPALQPNALGQYLVDGKTYVKVDQHVYEQTFDPQLDAWRIKHPTDNTAYQPVLKHNRCGAWRHSHEQPLQWSRQTLLRRLGHATDLFDDPTLALIGDVSGITDDVLRQIHVDGRPIPAILMDTLEQFGLGREPGLVPEPALGGAGKQSSADLEVLRRRYPMLSERVARELLGQVGEGDLARMRQTQRLPVAIDDQARTLAQQSRLSRALGGLCLPGLASLDSQRLALHCLEQLPGWPGGLRLEIRASSGTGRLLASIGSEDAPIRQCLIKQDIGFTLADSAGEPGLNLFDALAQALPEQTRHALGLPATRPGADLQQALGRYAAGHRTEMASALKLRAPRSRPRLQKVNGRPGYPLSGRGNVREVSESLIMHMREVYPNMTDDEVTRYISKRLDAGHSDQQIYHSLMTRQREVEGLRASLQQWADAARDPFSRDMREQVGERLVMCWREGVHGNAAPSAYLSLDIGHEHIGNFPELQADFSHVRTLKLDADLMLSEPEMGFVRRFAGVQRLEVIVDQANLTGLTEGLAQASWIKDLTLEARWQGFTREFMEQLQSVPHFERLTLVGPLERLDLSGWPRLRALRVRGHLGQWPTGWLDLEHLETLDLSGAVIDTLPEELFSGHPRIWRGLRLDWSCMDPQTVMKAYQYLRDNPAHLVDMEQWIASYCRSCLRRYVPQDQQLYDWVLAQFTRPEQGLPELLVRVNALHAEQRAVTAAIDVWTYDRPATADTFFRRQVADRLQRCWSQGIASRLGLEDARPGPSSQRSTSAEYLDISRSGVHDLPQLPANVFTHVQFLDMSNLRVPLEELERFLGAFTQVRALDLSRNGLTAIPQVLGEMRQVTDLDLAYNELTINPSIQNRLNTLPQLQKLSLQGNRVIELDVSALTGLKALDLSDSGIRQWPTGVLQLPQLRQLNLNRSAITQVPEAALQDHDQLMLGTHLSGCRLSPQSCADLLAYARRTGRDTAGDISPQLLASGNTNGTPEFFPDEVSDNPDLLLPVAPGIDPGQGHPDPGVLLQRIHPGLGPDEASAGIEQLRSQGLDGGQIDARLLQWNNQYDALVQRLNSWIDTPSYRYGGRWVSAVDRRRAADRILQAWRHVRGGAATVEVESSHSLDFSDLCLGDITALHTPIEHVTSLNLSGVRITEQGSDAFISEFPALNTLRLNNNTLTRLPDALGSLDNLTRLEVSNNELQGGEGLQHQLQSLAHLEWLDLSHNRLESFDLTGLNQLQTLDLRSNSLTRWPAQALHSPTLRTLNLSNNHIDYIPGELFDGSNDLLMAGTDLSDNLLSDSGYEVLRDYMDFSGNNLGYSRDEVEYALQSSDSTSHSSIDSDEDLEHPASEPEALQKARWFEGVVEDSPKHELWDDLRAEEGSEGLFHLLAQLKHTRDFIHDRADLAKRVWEVLEAAHSDALLRSELFVIAHSPLTCGDGRILLFSDLEVKVYEFTACRSVVPGEEGPALLKLARGLYRLGQVEEIASAAIRLHPDIDPAEIRLAYRTSLARRLNLPRQPEDMLFRNASGVTAQDIEVAYAQIHGAENAPGFMEQLIAQEYWVSYLKRKYVAEFSALEHRFEMAAEALQDQHLQLDHAYGQAMEALAQKRKEEVHQLLISLSQRERTEIEHG